MAIAGHVSQKMLAHYSHVRLDAKRKALEALVSDATGGHDTNNDTKQKAAAVANVLRRRTHPLSQARVETSVNLDESGNPDPYFMSIDLGTARHPQTLLATHFNGHPLTADHGAPLRLPVPVKLGLKNVKAITKITYSRDEPRDYWAERGYSRYDGI